MSIVYIGISIFILIGWPLPFSVASAWACDGQNLKKGSKRSLGRSELKPGCFADSDYILGHVFHRSNLVESTPPSNNPNSRYRIWNRSGPYLVSPWPRLKRGGHRSPKCVSPRDEEIQVLFGFTKTFRKYTALQISQEFKNRTQKSSHCINVWSWNHVFLLLSYMYPDSLVFYTCIPPG